MRIALFQPEIPQNVGAVLRLAACLNIAVDVIEPTGFPWDDKRVRLVGMDYIDHVSITRHPSWEAFKAHIGLATADGAERAQPARLILLTTKTNASYISFDFRQGDILLLGQESAGAPAEVHETVDARVTIPMHPPMRSMNLAQSAAMVLGEALRQTGSFPSTS
ncbi:MAG: tRNA (cytidine(34)-2'-O)-methyltransferase [Pseudomonadota bacterium]